MKNFVLFPLLAISFSCGKQTQNDQTIVAKNKTIDSLKAKLEDCKGQAKIMAEVLEQERLKEKATQ